MTRGAPKPKTCSGVRLRPWRPRALTRRCQGGAVGRPGSETEFPAKQIRDLGRREGAEWPRKGAKCSKIQNGRCHSRETKRHLGGACGRRARSGAPYHLWRSGSSLACSGVGYAAFAFHPSLRHRSESFLAVGPDRRVHAGAILSTHFSGSLGSCFCRCRGRRDHQVDKPFLHKVSKVRGKALRGGEVRGINGGCL